MIAPGPYILNPSSMAANQTQPLATYYTYPGSVANPTSYVAHGATNGASNGLTNPTYVLHQNSVSVASKNQNHRPNWTAYQASPSYVTSSRISQPQTGYLPRKDEVYWKAGRF